MSRILTPQIDSLMVLQLDLLYYVTSLGNRTLGIWKHFYL